MATGPIHMTLLGLPALQRAMAARRQRLANRRATNARAVAAVDRWVQQNFKQEGGLAQDGGWAPLAPATRRARRRGANTDAGQRILQDSGQMRSRWKRTWTATRASIQSGVDYARYHQTGTQKMPRRAILPSEEQIAPVLVKIFKRFVGVSIR